LSAIAKRAVGGGYFLLHEYAEAENWLRSALELNPLDVDSRFLLAQVLIRQRRYEEALLEAKAAERSDRPLSAGLMGQILGLKCDVQQARRTLDTLRKLSERSYVDPLSFMMVHLGLGENEAALRWFDQALRNHSPLAILLEIAPKFDLIRDLT